VAQSIILNWLNPPIHQNENAEITVLLRAWGRGDSAALDQLTPIVFAELRRTARRYLRNERAGNSLQTTALLHEAYLRLVDLKETDWQDRTHFFAISARLMRRILVDAARSRVTARRGGGKRADHSSAVDLDAIPDLSSDKSRETIALDDALNALEKIDPRKVRVIELRFFAGLTAEETAEALKISPNSVLRDWRLAKSWLLREMSGTTGPPVPAG
jgi:RNA polymerase sigma factor (TIGR02999 family)